MTVQRELIQLVQLRAPRVIIQHGRLRGSRGDLLAGCPIRSVRSIQFIFLFSFFSLVAYKVFFLGSVGLSLKQKATEDAFYVRVGVEIEIKRG